MDVTSKTYHDAFTSGLVLIGEWGNPYLRQSGAIFAAPEDVVAVLAAYDAIDDGDLSPEVLTDVYAAGGIFIQHEGAEQ